MFNMCYTHTYTHTETRVLDYLNATSCRMYRADANIVEVLPLAMSSLQPSCNTASVCVCVCVSMWHDVYV